MIQQLVDSRTEVHGGYSNRVPGSGPSSGENFVQNKACKPEDKDYFNTGNKIDRPVLADDAKISVTSSNRLPAVEPMADPLQTKESFPQSSNPTRPGGSNQNPSAATPDPHSRPSGTIREPGAYSPVSVEVNGTSVDHSAP